MDLLDCDGGYCWDDVCIAPPPTCADLVELGLFTESGLYELQPDPEAPPLFTRCEHDGEHVWTVVGQYRSNLELFSFSPYLHQVQDLSGGETLDAPPTLDDETYGHIAFDTFTPEAVRLRCQRGPSADWYHEDTELFGDWGLGIKGTYATSRWGVLGGPGYGRSNHFICGYRANPGVYAGIAICSGAGAGGSWSNHRVSLSFTPSRSSYTGGLSIGCSGSGANNGKHVDWGAEVWFR